MADDRAYRILLQFDSEHERFNARVPELDIEATGENRAAALEAAESAIEAKYEAAATDRVELPRPVDVREVAEEISVQLAAPLARELQFHADRSKMSADALAEQLLVRAIGLLNVGLRPPPRPRAEKPAEGDKAESEGNEKNERQERGGRKGGRGRGRGGHGRRGEGYRPEIEDQANFLAYVRDMEKGGGRRR